MKIKEFIKIKKQETPEKIIRMYCADKIYLTDKQLTEVIALKNGTNKKRIK